MKNSFQAPRRYKTRGASVFSILALLDPLQGPTGPYPFKKDSSHLLLLALSHRGHKIYYTDPSGLFLESPKKGLRVKAARVAVLESEPYFSFQKEEILPADFFRLILMRKDPPVDLHYIDVLQLLEVVSKKVSILNPPCALRNWNEKMIILNFPRWIPPTLVTSNKKEMDRFIKESGGQALLKPLEGFASQGVLKINQAPLAPLKGNRMVMIQAYLDRVKDGEKRIFMVDGKPLGALLKTPVPGSFLTNPDTGATLSPTRLTSQEKKLCQEVGLFLKKQGIFFAGMDVIGGRLTEINITSPGLLWEWNEVDNKQHEEEIVDLIERRYL